MSWFFRPWLQYTLLPWTLWRSWFYEIFESANKVQERSSSFSHTRRRRNFTIPNWRPVCPFLTHSWWSLCFSFTCHFNQLIHIKTWLNTIYSLLASKRNSLHIDLSIPPISLEIKYLIWTSKHLTMLHDNSATWWS